MYNIKRHYTFISSFSDPYKQPIPLIPSYSSYVESRFGNCPHKTTVVEEWAKNWQLAPEGLVTSYVGNITKEGVFISKVNE